MGILIIIIYYDKYLFTSTVSGNVSFATKIEMNLAVKGIRIFFSVCDSSLRAITTFIEDF
jgi:hypothetical protein